MLYICFLFSKAVITSWKNFVESDTIFSPETRVSENHPLMNFISFSWWNDAFVTYSLSLYDVIELTTTYSDHYFGVPRVVVVVLKFDYMRVMLVVWIWSILALEYFLLQ